MPASLSKVGITIGVSLAVLSLANCGGTEPRAFDETPKSATTAPAADGGGVVPPSEFGDAAITNDSAPNVCTEDIDVVLALDVSSSMGFALDKLDAEFAKVVTASNALKAGAHFGLVLFVDNVKVDATGDLEGGKVHTGAATLTTAFRDAKAMYTTPDRNPGDGPSGPQLQNPICEENSLDALHSAVTDFPWRKNAARIVIIVTDDTFLEGGDNYGDRDNDGKTDKTNFPSEGDYPARFGFDETVTALKNEQIRVFSFTKMKPPGFFDFGKCTTGRRHSENDCQSFGWSKPYDGKAPIPTSTGGKNFDLDAVKAGTLSLTATINEVVLESHCAGPPK